MNTAFTINNENTTDKAHSVFPPSSAKRHIECTPSLVLESFFPNETSEAAEEGTAAHALGEYKARVALGLPVEGDKPVSEFDCPDMEEHTDSYVRLIQNAAAAMNDPVVMLERAVCFDSYVPGGYGTADCIIINETELHIIDFKYGRVKVEATNNAQMMCYALGCLQDFSVAYPNIQTVRMTIFQPRVGNVDTWTAPVWQICEWGNKVLRPRGLMALAGEGEFSCGEWCKYCKGKNCCAKRNSEFTALASNIDFDKKNDIYTDEEIAALLPLSEMVKKWAEDLQTYAEKRAVNEGKKWDGYKLVVGRYTNAFTSEEEVVNIAKDNDIDPHLLVEESFVSPAKLEGKIGKKAFKALFGTVVTKTPGKLKLVPEDDNREEVVVNLEVKNSVA